MRQLLDSDLELVVESHFIYLPLLFDPEIEKETLVLSRPGRPLKNSGQPESETIIKIEGKHFVKSLSIHSLLENYEAINTYQYERLRNDCLRKYQLTHGVDDIFQDGTLRTILFQVMPYFIRKNRGLQRKKLSDEEILDLIDQHFNIPRKYHEEAKVFRDLKPLKRILRDLEDQNPIWRPPGNGLFSARKLREWFHEAIHAKILASEHDRLTKALKVRRRFSRAKPEHIAVLLYVADTGGMELDGFGFTRNKSYKREYLVYKRTGEYVLKDYYARSYLFPDCRVAVSTYAPFRPFVMEKYKHPFLLGHKSGQEICMRNFEPPEQLTAKNVIRTLEEGLTALRYGYDARRRNGYHSLDKTWVHVPTIEFDEYRIEQA
ncbi:MAG: hypothetical protein AMK69_21465 [Nitrospira bacterium SG8_3]|nr:MAG: hypothetical protein AMK69_21465 [Nitrospira bacterium SG8_3]